MSEKPKIRCAIYTRKSCEEGLEQEYNSLDAQYDAGLHYIRSQAHEGWMPAADRYDDGGFSGGNIERPALKRLIDDIRKGMVDVVVVYKIDRLSRSLLDFLNLMKVFEEHKVSFVSVTQHFNTDTSMGKLMLNVLLSFAQFEREITGERIRDKIAATKKKGLWAGGVPTLGYDSDDKKLVVNRKEAEIVRFIFEQFARHGSPTTLVRQLEEKGYRSKAWTSSSGVVHGGRKIDTGMIHRILRNPVYIGRIRHKNESYDGQHEPIVTPELWDQAQRIAAVAEAPNRRARNRVKLDFFLRGLIFDTEGRAMTPTHTRKKSGKLYRYYVSVKAIKEGYEQCPIKTIAADQIEDVVIRQIRQMVAAPEMVYRAYELASAKTPSFSYEEVRATLEEFNAMWDQLFPVERNRLVRLLVDRIVVGRDGLQITYHSNGLLAACQEIQNIKIAA